MSTEVFVFDIGGTWFRSAVLTPDDRLEAVTRRPAINYRNTPGRSVPQLQRDLVEYLVGRVGGRRAAGVSLGAALNAHTGLVLNSGPLWGPECVPFDLLAALREGAPSVEWALVNDVTAALLHHVRRPAYSAAPRVMLLTVSTGIACRVYDTRTRTVPLDRTHGVQGEIGHLPIAFRYDGRQVELNCDCGGANHLNAFCSGRGIEALLLRLAAAETGKAGACFLSGLGRAEPGGSVFRRFVRAVVDGDPLAAEVLDAVTWPVAYVILHALTLDPEVEAVILTGGVVNTLGERYVASLLRHLDDLGMYQVTPRDPQFFRRRLRLEADDETAGLVGAGLYARELAASRPARR